MILLTGKPARLKLRVMSSGGTRVLTRRRKRSSCEMNTVQKTINRKKKPNDSKKQNTRVEDRN